MGGGLRGAGSGFGWDEGAGFVSFLGSGSGVRI